MKLNIVINENYPHCQTLNLKEAMDQLMPNEWANSNYKYLILIKDNSIECTIYHKYHISRAPQIAGIEFSFEVRGNFTIRKKAMIKDGEINEKVLSKAFNAILKLKKDDNELRWKEEADELSDEVEGRREDCRTNIIKTLREYMFEDVARSICEKHSDKRAIVKLKLSDRDTAKVMRFIIDNAIEFK